MRAEKDATSTCNFQIEKENYTGEPHVCRFSHVYGNQSYIILNALTYLHILMSISFSATANTYRNHRKHHRFRDTEKVTQSNRIARMRFQFQDGNSITSQKNTFICKIQEVN